MIILDFNNILIIVNGNKKILILRNSLNLKIELILYFFFNFFNLSYSINIYKITKTNNQTTIETLYSKIDNIENLLHQ